MKNNKVKMNLNNIDGNIFAIVGTFLKHAKQQGWDQESMDNFSKKITSSKTYSEALGIILANVDEVCHESDNN